MNFKLLIYKIKLLQNHKGFIKYFSNTSWLFVEKILRMTVGLFVGVWVARYLGPENFGLISYAQSFVGLFTAIATLGLNGIVVRELIKDKKNKDELIGTAFWLKIIGAIAVLIILALAIQFTSNDQTTNILIFIIASGTVFQSFNVIDFYFQSKVLSRYVVYANIISLFLSSLFKIVLILYEAPLVAFAWVVLFDSFVLAIGLIYFFFKHSKFNIQNLTFRRHIALFLLNHSWPLIISGVSVGFGMRIDQIFLKEMISAYEVGIYSAGVRLAEPLVIIPVIISQSIFPKLMKMDEIKNINQFVLLFRVLFYILLGLALIIAVSSDIIISSLYGDSFLNSSFILTILIFSIPLTFLNILSSKMLLKKNFQRIIMFRQLVLVFINIFINILLIPYYGAIGAAIATVLSDLLVGILIDFINKKTKYLFYIKIDAILFTKLSTK